VLPFSSVEFNENQHSERNILFMGVNEKLLHFLYFYSDLDKIQ
jgi:hypothetical protein